MDKERVAYEQLLQGIKNYVNQCIENSNSDITTNGIVKVAYSNGLYKVLINGYEYDNVPSIGGSCKVNETVLVLLPQHNYNNMIILKGGNGSGGGGSSSVTSVNGQIGDVTITANSLGLGNVGNFKAVSTLANQGLTEAEKLNSRINIGAGISNFSGDYNDLDNKPTEVTEDTVSNWGFTKNIGTYVKPSGGIPLTDLSEQLQTSINNADNTTEIVDGIVERENEVIERANATIQKADDIVENIKQLNTPFEMKIDDNGHVYYSYNSTTELQLSEETHLLWRVI